jgi:UDP-N-acetylmuramoylalanine-D-glutamate ligase
MFENLLSVLNRIADALEGGAIAPAAAAPEKKAAPAKSKAEAKPKAEPAEPTKAEITDEADGAATQAITTEMLQNAALVYAKANNPNGKQAVEAVLAPYGALKIKDLPTEHYAAVLAVFSGETEEF